MLDARNPAVPEADWPAKVLMPAAALGLLAGLAAQATPAAIYASVFWGVATAFVLLALLAQIVRSLRQGDLGLDIIAAMSMTAALVFGEPLAGNVIALMYAGGQWLEAYARGRARREMTALLGRVARTAMRYRGALIEEVPIGDIVPADRLLIREGEVLPVDGRVLRGDATLDLSALTGEPLPHRFADGEEVLSGSACAGHAFDLIAIRTSDASAYQNIVRLVKAAQESRAPMARMADRWALFFLAFTLAIAAASWLWSGETVRIVAVLVVATPCPLILAVPVALISGISRTSRIGVLVKGSDVLERLTQVRVAVLDKTGTLTHGRAEVTDITTRGSLDAEDILRLAASLDQASSHVAAASLITAARARGIALSVPEEVDESPGSGIEGTVDGHRVVVGNAGFVISKCAPGHKEPPSLTVAPDLMQVVVAVDGKVAGAIILADRLRSDTGVLMNGLRRAGIGRIVVASGDRSEVAVKAGMAIGADLSLGDLSPEDKVSTVQRERRFGKVLMVGDGVNDAPALAAADVGVAMGARGTASSSEVAGVVLLVDEIGRLADAIDVSRRSVGIAMQSAVIGLGLSTAAMLFAAAGYLPALQGALLQEAIDVAVILNALRALR